MNILIANISPLKKDKKDNTRKAEAFIYNIAFPGCSVSQISAVQTNESILRTVVNLDEINKTGGLGKVIALVSELAKKEDSVYKISPIGHYRNLVKELVGQDIVEEIEIEEKDSEGKIKNRKSAELLNDVCNKISQNDVVYIDSAGGMRTTSNQIQLLAKLLKYKGIKNPNNLYADIQNKNNCKIIDTGDFQRMMDLADSLNEFMTSGKSNQLYSYFNNEKAPIEVLNLISAMTEFSDKLQIGDVDYLEETLQKLEIAIKDFENVESNEDVGFTILKQFLPVIKTKLLSNETSDYLKIIKWCVDNGLIQQAITLFVEKIPIYIFNKGLIKYNGDIQMAKRDFESKKNNALTTSWECNAFYTEILSYDQRLMEELRYCIENEKTSNNGQVCQALKKIKKIENMWINTDALKKEFIYIYNKRKQSNANNFVSFKKTICNDGTILSKFLDIEYISDTYEKKFKEIKNLQEGKLECKPYIIVGSYEKMANVYYAYMYVKLLRNKINHASSDENFTEENKKILSEAGYNFDDENLLQVKNNLEIAIKMVEEAVNQFTINLSNKPVEEAVTVTYSTNLKVGDKVMAFCVREKKVIIPEHDYEISLVIPKGDNPIAYINKNVMVEIKQISKINKIAQVKVIN